MSSSGQDDASTKTPPASSVFLPPAQKEPPVLKRPESEAKLERQRRSDIRKILIAQARDKYADLSAQGATAYGEQLRAMETGVNQYLSNSGYQGLSGREAIVLNPDDFSLGRALGFDSKEIVRRMLEQRGVEAPKDAVADIAAGMNRGYESKFGVVARTQDAGVRDFDAKGEKRPYVMAPSSDNIGPNRVPGMSYADNMEFINRHETWHIKDSWYDLSHLDRETVATVRGGFASNYIANSDEAQEAFSLISRKEAISDISAIGDMMRDRKANSYQVLNQVIDWRQSRTEDDTHTSVPVLKGMKAEIEKMGFGNFMKMTEDQVHTFYHDVTEKYGMSPEAVADAANYAEASREDRKQMLAEKGSDPEMKKAMEFLSHQKSASSDETFRHEDDIKKKIDAYEPKQALLDRAFEIGTKITPETIILAHHEMADALFHQATDADVAARRLGQTPNPLYRLEMAKLQETFVEVVQQTDYVEANRKRGVVIEEVEPALEKLAAPATDGGLATARPLKKSAQKPAPG